MKTLFTIATLLITLAIQAQNVNGFHVYKKDIVSFDGTEYTVLSTVPNEPTFVLADLLAGMETTDPIIDLDQNGVVNVVDVITYLGSSELLWNPAQFGCNLPITLYECFVLQRSEEGFFIDDWDETEQYLIFYLSNPDTGEYQIWYWVSN